MTRDWTAVDGSYLELCTFTRQDSYLLQLHTSLKHLTILIQASAALRLACPSPESAAVNNPSPDKPGRVAECGSAEVSV